MPKGLFTLWIVELKEFDLTRTLKWPINIPEKPLVCVINTLLSFGIKKTLIQSSHSVIILHFGNNDLFGHLRRYLLGNHEWRSLKTHSVFGLTIRHSDLYRFSGKPYNIVSKKDVFFLTYLRTLSFVRRTTPPRYQLYLSKTVESLKISTRLQDAYHL